jgi:hypothetical protein
MSAIKPQSKSHVFTIRLTAEQYAFIERVAMKETAEWQRRGNFGEVSMSAVLRHSLIRFIEEKRMEDKRNGVA